MSEVTALEVSSYVQGHWLLPDASARNIARAYDGVRFARAGHADIDFAAARTHAVTRGGPALARLTFHDRARLLKAIAIHLNGHKQALYDLSYATGATTKDHAFDIDGGIGTLFVYASKGRREMPDAHLLPDGDVERLGRNGEFLGLHVYTPLQGVAVHINAFNFPVWGFLEKFAPSILAGLPVIVKPATATSYVTEACVRLIVDSGVLPEGALQLVHGRVDGLLAELGAQDVLTFTGSAETAGALRNHPGLATRGVRFSAEQDSLNAAILGPDAVPGTPEFDIFIREVIREMTVKAGQKCTAIRRIIVPDTQTGAVIEILRSKLGAITVGDPRDEAVRMGSLVSVSQRDDVIAKCGMIAAEAERVFGTDDAQTLIGDGLQNGAFVMPQLFHAHDPDRTERIHDTEAFGPVATVMGYGDLVHSLDLANRGRGSLVTSLFSHDADVAREAVMALGGWNGRFYINNRDSAREATGHGAPMPHLTHGGPGRAGGGEEQGGIRGVRHFMQRTAIQGSPDMLTAITGRHVPGSAVRTDDVHPFRKRFGELAIGDTLHTKSRKITIEDIEHFAHFTGDTFYAHMDAEAAKRNPFFPDRVAHGYALISFAAGLFVDPDEGPVLANTGLDNLRFMKPVVAGDAIGVTLTVMQKTARNETYGEVRWAVRLSNQDDETVATYELLTMVAR